MKKIIGSICLALSLFGCSSQDVPPAHKGRMLDKTGPLAFYKGGVGFNGPVLSPGTYYTAVYPEIRTVECAQKTVKESLTALTKDGVQFSLDVYVSYGANCDEEKAVVTLLEKLSPYVPEKKVDGDKYFTITSDQIYGVYVRSLIGESVRESVSPYIANDINSKREEMFEKIKISFDEKLKTQNPKLVVVYNLNLSNLDFPDAMDNANAERATQVILMDKAIAERGKVEAEIKTAKMREDLARQDAQNEVVKIDALGAALRRNPEYNLNDIISTAAQKGNMILATPTTGLVLQVPKR
jgi:hypothetical protein